MEKISLEKIKWIARITATIMFVFLLPFYLGYGIPFPSSSLSLLENIHLIIMPIILIGLIAGWKWEKIAGYMICVPISIKLLVALIFLENPGPINILLIIPGILYLIYGYQKKPEVSKSHNNQKNKLCEVSLNSSKP